IRNNIFYKDLAPSIYIWDARISFWKTGFEIDNNLYFDGSATDASEGEKSLWFTDYQPSAEGAWFSLSENPDDLYTVDEFNDWIINSDGFDINSFVEENPLFYQEFSPESDSFNYDLRLEDSSCAIGSGVYIEKYASHVDVWGNKPLCKFNIGAYSGGGNIDHEPPLLEVQDALFSLDSSGSLHLKPLDFVVSASDNCIIIDTLIDQSIIDCGNIGSPLEIEITVSDISGNSVSGTASVTVIDTISPVLVLPEPITVYADESDQYTVLGNEFDPVFISDNCTYSVRNNINDDSTLLGETLNIGKVQITWTAEDISGNRSSDIFEVDVKECDMISPTLVVHDVTVYLDEEGKGSCGTSDVVVSVSDNSEIKDTKISRNVFICSEASDSVEIYITATDIFDNVSIENAFVYVLDTLCPILQLPVDQIISANSSNTYTVMGSMFDPIIAGDNCGYNVLNDYNDANSLNSAEFMPGIHTIRWKVTDASGNISSGIQQIEVNEFVGILENEVSSYVLYPNPVADFLHVAFLESIAPVDITIYDLTGRVIYNVENIKYSIDLDFSSNPTGFYFIRICCGEDISCLKIIKAV
ncbi:MAG: T9SS type A sorting domain-containing protein, partial [Bacteroidales bacterium]|nr:T9SS type A sorting domain-containing protein [Bacteroidales bacterium]